MSSFRIIFYITTTWLHSLLQKALCLAPLAPHFLVAPRLSAWIYTCHSHHNYRFTMARGARERRSLASNKHMDRGNDSKEGVAEESTFVFDQSLVTPKQRHSALVIERHYLAYREAVRTYHNKLSWARESHEKFSELLQHLTGENISRYIYKMCWPSEHRTMMKSIKKNVAGWLSHVRGETSSKYSTRSQVPKSITRYD